MRFLYILECMLMVILNDGTLVLISTKEPMTPVDFFIGFFAWIILAFLIFGIMFFVKYSRNKVLLKKRREDEKINHKKQKIFTKKYIKNGFIFLGISLFILTLGIVISVFANDGSIARIIGVGMLEIGVVTTVYSIIIPLFEYLWRRLDV